MANRFYSPEQQFVNNSGVPYAGGQLFFYATGTSVLQNTYSDQALTIANTNPVVLDSNGQTGSIFLQNLAYKVVLEDVNNNQIWTMDPVYTSDYSTFAGAMPWNGNPNGNVAGVAGTQGALPPTSMVWDYADKILYICTTTGNAATAVWTAINSGSTSALNVVPQGYLTPQPDPSNPIATNNYVATTVYYTPYKGNQIPVFNGSSFILNTFSQLSLSLTASQASNTIYDVFVFNNAGVLTLVAGPAWSNSNLGTGARGSGGGTTQLQRLNGIWVNAVQITGRNGGTSYTIPANVATYVGSLYMDASAGNVTCNRTAAISNKWGVWNAYNRVPITLQAGTNAGWSYSTATYRAFNGNSNFCLFSFVGLPEETIRTDIQIQGILPNPTSVWQIAIGLNSSTTPFCVSSAFGTPTITGATFSGGANNIATPCATGTVQPGSIGANQLIFLEYSNGGVNVQSNTINGLMTYRG